MVSGPSDDATPPDRTARGLGHHGPDQGFIYHLLPLFDNEICLIEGEARTDIDAGCIAVALKRASIFGRAPQIADLRIAYTIFGFLDPNPSLDLIEARLAAFEGVHLSGHYTRLRSIADSIDSSVLKNSPDGVASSYLKDWRSQIS